MTAADLRAQLAALWDRAHPGVPPPGPTPADWPTVTRLAPATFGGPRVPDGFTAWAVGPWSDEPDTSRHVTVLPTLAPTAPPAVWRRYLARVVGNGAGTCPLCGAVAGFNADPEHTPAGWALLPITVGIRHEPDCPATFGDEDRHHFLPPTGTAPDPEDSP